MTDLCLPAVACAAMLAAFACGNEQTTPQPANAPKPAAAVSQKAAEDKQHPYTYPPPVKGHFNDINVGDFDLVDGVAYTAKGSAGTVVHVTDKPIASPLLADSPCPMTQARALLALRDAGYAEVTVDAAGRSKYFASGKAIGGQGREEDVAGRYWSIKLREAGAGRVAGTFRHKDHGGFEFDLPVSSPKVAEASAGDWTKSRLSSLSGPVPSNDDVTAAYQAVREAALKKDLKALLAAQGFDEKQIAAIRGLDRIDGDFAVFSDRFLEPGTPDEIQTSAGYGAVSGAGANSKGAKFLNFYEFAPCRQKLVLVRISENRQ